MEKKVGSSLAFRGMHSRKFLFSHDRTYMGLQQNALLPYLVALVCKDSALASSLCAPALAALSSPAALKAVVVGSSHSHLAHVQSKKYWLCIGGNARVGFLSSRTRFLAGPLLRTHTRK